VASLSSVSSLLRLGGLEPSEIAELSSQAKGEGVSPERLLARIVRDRLAVAREARTKTFAQIAAPIRREAKRRPLSDADLDALISGVRRRQKRKSVR